MKKQTTFRLSKTKNNILHVFSGVLLALFAGLILFPTISESTHAEGDMADEGITIVFSPEIDIALASSDKGYYKVVKDTIEISTSSQNGYTLYLSTDSAEHQDIYLNGDTSSSSKISGTSGTYESPKPLEDYTWGWAVPGMSHFNDSYDTTNPSTDAKFAATPLSNQIIRDYIKPVAGDTAEVYYGFKLGGELETGNYETNITYTAVPATQPLMAKAIFGENDNLNFVYDRNTYVAGETYTDNLGETIIANVYEIPMNNVECTSNTRMPWYNQRDSILGVNIDVSFVNARPTSTCGWFRLLKNAVDITNLQNLNTSNVYDMGWMFAMSASRAHADLAWDLSSWDTSNVTNMYKMFYDTSSSGATTFSLNLSGWNTDNVTDMSDMFGSAGSRATTFSLNLSGWNTGNVVNMASMFNFAGSNATTWSVGDLSGWDTSNVTNMNYMFNGAGSNATTFDIGDLGGWKTNNVTDMSNVFSSAGRRATTWNIGDLSGWDTGNVTDMGNMFDHAGFNATTWNIGDLSGWNTGNVTRMSDMFDAAGYNATTWNIGDLSGWDTGSVTSMNYMFSAAGYKATTWNIGDIHTWNVENVTTHTGFIGLNVNQTNASVVNNQPAWN